MPVRIIITEGTRADCKEGIHLIEGISAEALLADRGYGTNGIIAYALSQDMEVVIPSTRNRKGQTALRLMRQNPHHAMRETVVAILHQFSIQPFPTLGQKASEGVSLLCRGYAVGCL